MTGSFAATPATSRPDSQRLHVILQRDLDLGLNVTRYSGDQSMTGVVVAIDRDTDEEWSGSGPWCTVRWDSLGIPGGLSTQVPAGHLLRVGRRLHWNGDPEACAADCDGSHWGDHIAPDAVCQRCGGAARQCWTGTDGSCSYTRYPANEP